MAAATDFLVPASVMSKPPLAEPDPQRDRSAHLRRDGRQASDHRSQPARARWTSRCRSSGMALVRAGSGHQVEELAVPTGARDHPADQCRRRRIVGAQHVERRDVDRDDRLPGGVFGEERGQRGDLGQFGHADQCARRPRRRGTAPRPDVDKLRNGGHRP